MLRGNTALRTLHLDDNGVCERVGVCVLGGCMEGEGGQGKWGSGGGGGLVCLEGVRGQGGECLPSEGRATAHGRAGGGRAGESSGGGDFGD
jgi:hypothetical protein